MTEARELYMGVEGGDIKVSLAKVPERVLFLS